MVPISLFGSTVSYSYMKDRIMNEMLTYRAVLVDVILKHTGTGLGTGRPVNTPMPDSIDEDLCEPVAS